MITSKDGSSCSGNTARTDGGSVTRIEANGIGHALLVAKQAMGSTAVGDAVEQALAELRQNDGGTLRQQRREKFLAMGSKGLA